jgi:hypothetical protein
MRKFLLVLLALIGFLTSKSQSEFGFSLPKGERRVEIPFENYNNLILVKAVVNNRLPLFFIFDTGVQTSIITDKSLSDMMQVHYDHMYTLAGVGEHKQFNVYLANNVSIDFPDVSGKGLNLLVLEEDYLLLKNYLGTPVHGILGCDLLQNLVVSIDYDKRKLIVYDPDTYRAPKKAIAIPILIHDGKPYIQLPIELSEGKKVLAKLLIDTGASHAMLLELFSDPKIILKDNFIHTTLGRGLAGSIEGWIGRVKNVNIGKFQLNNVLSFFTDTNSYSTNFVLAGRNGTIGGDLMGRFIVTLDYKNQMMYFESNGTTKQPFEFNMAGFDVISSGDFLDKIEVVNVIEKSPAYEAGMRAGDFIIRFNNMRGKSLSINELNNILRGRPGKKVKILLDRNDKKIKIEFKLRRLV